MSVQHLPAKPKPPGYRSFQDVAMAIAVANGWTQTGFHFAEEPSTKELEYIARAHYSNQRKGFVFPLTALHPLKIESDDPNATWTVFRSARTWWEPAQ